MIPAYGFWGVGRNDLSPGSKLDLPAEQQPAQSKRFLNRLIETVELHELPFSVDHGYKVPPLVLDKLPLGPGFVHHEAPEKAHRAVTVAPRGDDRDDHHENPVAFDEIPWIRLLRDFRGELVAIELFVRARAHDMVCVDECSGSASVRATLAGLSLALEPEPAHGLGFAQVVRA